MKSLLQTAWIFIHFQWQDRKKTSSFLIGITLQTVVLSLAIIGISKNADEAFANALRAYFFTAVNIMMFAAMSNLSNEFRFGTIAPVVISKIGLNRLILFRSMANAVVSLPCLIIPLAASYYYFPATLSKLNILGVAMAVGFVVALCYFSSYIFTLFPNPHSVMPWLRYYFLILGLSIIPGLETIGFFLPIVWTYKIIEKGFLAKSVVAYLLTMLPYIIIPRLLIQPKLLSRIEAQLSKGSLRL